MFRAYGASHWAAIAALVVGAAGLVWWGRRHRDTLTAQRVRRGLALAILVVVVPFQVYVLLPDQWNLGTSLPLQLCDLAWMVAVIALWTGRWWASALTFYWGLTLSSQAFLTPTLDGRDFPHLDYVMFWGLHLLVVWAAIYLTWGLGWRPDWRGYAVAVGTTASWGLAMLVFNDLAGTNYGFVTEKPPGGSVLDLLGDWPWYLLSELALGSAVWALMTWPFASRPIYRRHMKTPDLALVPALVGLDTAEAHEVAMAARIIAVAADSEPDTPPTLIGTVIAQQPEPGTRIPAGDAVTIWTDNAGGGGGGGAWVPDAPRPVDPAGVK